MTDFRQSTADAPLEASVWTDSYVIRSYEIDPHGRASLQSICNFLQESAGRHAETLGLAVPDLLGQNLTWVLARLRVEMDEYPALWETLHLETWPAGTDGLTAVRHFRLHNAAGNMIGRATTAWMLLDVARRRPVRMPEAVTSIRLPDEPPPLADPFHRLRPADGGATDHRFRVRYSDLDLNRHVNNVRYVEWAVESVPRAILEATPPSAIEVHFRAETSYGETVRCRTVPVAREGTRQGLAFDHRLVAGESERDVALVRTYWPSVERAARRPGSLR